MSYEIKKIYPTVVCIFVQLGSICTADMVEWRRWRDVCSVICISFWAFLFHFLYHTHTHGLRVWGPESKLMSDIFRCMQRVCACMCEFVCDMPAEELAFRLRISQTAKATVLLPSKKLLLYLHMHAHLSICPGNVSSFTSQYLQQFSGRSCLLWLTAPSWTVHW